MEALARALPVGAPGRFELEHLGRRQLREQKGAAGTGPTRGDATARALLEDEELVVGGARVRGEDELAPEPGELAQDQLDRPIRRRELDGERVRVAGGQLDERRVGAVLEVAELEGPVRQRPRGVAQPVGEQERAPLTSVERAQGRQR